MLSRRSDAASAASRQCDLVFWEDVRDEEAFFSGIGGTVRALVTASTVALPCSLLSGLPALELIAFFGAGYADADLAACRSRGIAVVYVPSTNYADVADVAIGLMISAVRRLSEGDQVVRSGEWTGPLPVRATPSLRELRYGIVGLGMIGRAIAERLEPFGGSIRWWGPRAKQDAPWARASNLNALATEADVLLVAVKGDNSTRRLIDEGVLGALGPRGYLINVSRGFVVDEEALLTALRTEKLAGAGLDVFATEPTDPQRWRDLRNVALAPHIGGLAHASLEESKIVLEENLRRHFAGEQLLTPVPE